MYYYFTTNLSYVLQFIVIFRYGITIEPKKSLVPLTKCDQQTGENCFVAFTNGTEAMYFIQAIQSHVI